MTKCSTCSGTGDMMRFIIAIIIGLAALAAAHAQTSPTWSGYPASTNSEPMYVPVYPTFNTAGRSSLPDPADPDALDTAASICNRHVESSACRLTEGSCAVGYDDGFASCPAILAAAYKARAEIARIQREVAEAHDRAFIDEVAKRLAAPKGDANGR
jgi:hypothetical protein